MKPSIGLTSRNGTPKPGYKVILLSGSPSEPTPALEKPLVKLPTTRQASLKSKDQTALEICLQKMEELVKKELVTPSPDTTTSSRLVVLKAHIASSSSSRTSSDSEKEIKKARKPVSRFRGKKALPTNPDYPNQK